MTLRLLLTSVALALVPQQCGAADNRFSLGGLLFGDVYHIASHHTADGDGATGVVLRRGYLTADFAFSENWYGRARIEVNQSGEFETYDFEADFKDLFVARRIGRHKVIFGLSPSRTFDLSESIWGLRYLARTPMDLQGVASRDTGISADGPLNKAGTLSYRAMLGAGIEFGNESGDGNKHMLAIAWEPAPGYVLDFYVDYERLAGQTDRTTGQIFAGFDSDNLRWGIQYSDQDRQDDPPLKLASAFVVRPVRENLSVIGRVDRIIEPSPRGDNIAYVPFDPTAPATMFIGAVEFAPLPYLRLTPNVIWTTYDRPDSGTRPDDDLHLRLTFFLDFE